MEDDPNTKTMESSKKNLGRKKSYGEFETLEILKNYGFEKVETNITFYDGRIKENLPIFVYQHQTKDLIVFYKNFDIQKSKETIFVITNNHYRKDGSWVEQFQSNTFSNFNTIVKKYKPSSIKTLINFTETF